MIAVEEQQQQPQTSRMRQTYDIVSSRFLLLQQRDRCARATIPGLVVTLGFVALWGFKTGTWQGTKRATAAAEAAEKRVRVLRPPARVVATTSENIEFDGNNASVIQEDDRGSAGTGANGVASSASATNRDPLTSTGDGETVGKRADNDNIRDTVEEIRLKPPYAKPANTEGGSNAGSSDTAGDSSFCQEYLKFGGSSEITQRDFKCPACPVCEVFDLRNVAVKPYTSKLNITPCPADFLDQDNTLHIYAPRAETLKMVHQWGNRLPTLRYFWGGVEKSGSPIVVHEEPLEETMCPSRTRGVSFYSVPHYQENAYHLHNDNFMPISTNILSTPCLCDGVELSSCNRFEKTNVRTPQVKQKHGSTNPEFLDVFNTLFNHTLHLNKGAHGTNLAPARANGEFHCLDHMVWGFVKPYYIDCQADRSSTTWAWMHHALEYLGLPSVPPPVNVPLVPPAPPTGALPKVIFLHRNAVGPGKDKTSRFMRDLKPLRDAWAAEGIHMNDWRYNGSDSLKKMVGSLSGYDIYLGVHGAELTNVLYGNQGLVLVEVMSEGWDKEIFHKVAQARRGGYIKLRTLPGSHYQVDHDMAVKTVRCALALWRRDGNRIGVCNDAAPNPGPAQSFQKKPPKYKGGLAYFYEVGQS